LAAQKPVSKELQQSKQVVLPSELFLVVPGVSLTRGEASLAASSVLI
jgi:hypothetical protein